MIKQRIMLKEISEVEYIRYMRSQNSGSIHGENFHIWDKNHFSKTKIYFPKKSYTTLLRTYWATKKKEEWKQFLGDLPLFVWCILTLALKTNSLLWMAIKNDIWKLNPKIDGLVCCKTVVGSNYNLNLSLG